MSDSRITSALLTAYRQAEYKVQPLSSSPFTLCVDIYSAPLDELQRHNGATSSAIITACNPRSEQVGEAENNPALQRLRQDLKAAAAALIDCTGHDPHQRWPDEPGYLAIGLTLDTARRLGTLYGQNAILFSDSNAIPRLVMLE